MAENNSNMYDNIHSMVTNIAPKFFDTSKISTSRLGLFGYTTEVMAHAVENMTNEEAVLYNEMFFKKAILPESIYSYASHYNVENINAICAQMDFVLTLKESDILNNSLNDGIEDYFMLDNDSMIYVDGTYPFMLDYNIKISIKTLANGEHVYSAKYVTEGLDNPISSIKSTSDPYLKLSKITETRTNYILLYVTAHQCTKIEREHAITSDQFIDYFSFDVDCTPVDNVADFMVFYKAPNSDSYVQIKKYLIDSASSSEDPFCYYQYKDEGIVNISFSTSIRYFRPEYNSELKFIFFNTKGDKANFEYTGTNVLFNLKSNVYDYRDMIITVNNMSNSVGGKNKKSFEEIKNDVAYLASTCNCLSTETDLNKYFESLQIDSRILFVKKRDDVEKRLFGAYMLLRDSYNNIIPTNTLDLNIYNMEYDTSEVTSGQRFFIKPGTPMAYRIDSKEIEMINEKDISDNEFVYTCPFEIVVNKFPFIVSYFMNSIMQTMPLNFDKINDRCAMNFLAYNMDIKRNVIMGDDSYTFTVNLKPNIDNLSITLANVDVTDDSIFTDLDNMRVYLVIYDNKSKDSITHYFKMNMSAADVSKNNYKFEGSIKTDDFITIDNKIRITDNLIDVSDRSRVTSLINGTDLNVGIVVFLREDKPILYPEHSKLLNNESFSLCNVFKASDSINLINNMDDVMNSTLLAKKSLSKLYYQIKAVPVVKYDYIRNPLYSDAFFKNFLSNKNIINDKLSLLENLFNVSIKFYNTYGKSSYFYINNNKYNYLDRVNLSIYIDIALNSSKLSNSTVKEDITAFIKSYIESVNDTIDFHVSNLTTELLNKFSDIKYCNFSHINDYESSVQSIEKNFPMLKLDQQSRLKNFVPEYINTNKNYDGDIVNHDIIINFL